MRWDGLFADLEAQASALETAERAGEVDERVRSELARLPLIGRLHPAIGSLVRALRNRRDRHWDAESSGIPVDPHR